MLSRRMFGSMLAAGGMFLATQQAGAVIVVQDNVMLDGGTNLNATEYFGFGGPFTTNGVAESDGNLFAITTQEGNNSGAGFSHHIPIGDVTAVQSLTDGMALRASLWVMSDPNNPWNALATDGFKMEFYNVALGAFNTIDMTNETENGFGLGLSPIAQSLTTTGWTQQSFTVVVNDADVDFGSLQEIRPVMFQGDFSGASPGAGGGRMFSDGFTFEVFPNLATANATPLPNNVPGGFDIAPPVDLSGDINGDGFVGIADLNVILGNWNAGTPPVAPGPDVITNFSNFALTGTYEAWAGGTFTATADDFRIQATSFGGGYLTLASPLDATGETALEVKLDVNAGNAASILGFVLIDGDGTERVYQIPLVVGDNQTIVIDLIDYLQDNAVGTVPGLDLSNITTVHIQGSFADGNPGLAIDVTLDDLALTPAGTVLLDGDIAGAGGLGPDGFVGIADLNVVLGTWNNGTPPANGAAVPEPATLSLLALGGLSMLRRRSA